MGYYTDKRDSSGSPSFRYTADDLFAMKKSEQVALLRKLGVTRIPRFEHDRVKKILSLLR